MAAFVNKFASSPRAGAPGAAAPVLSPPSFVRQISSTGAPSAGAPCFPLFTLGLSASELQRVLPFVNRAQWRGRPLQLGRRPFDTAASPVRRAFFEPFLAARHFLGPIFRPLVRIRGAASGALESPPEIWGDIRTSVATARRAMPGWLSAPESKSALSEYAKGLPDSGAHSSRSAPSWIADEGPDVLGLLGVLPGMVFLSVARASSRARPGCLEPQDWERVIRAFVGRHATPPLKDLCEPGAPHLEQAANSSEFD